MRSSIQYLLFVSCLLLFSACQKAEDNTKLVTKNTTDVNGYTYDYVENDPSKTRIYTLENGLKVYLSVYKEEPRIMTYIPVKAGGKFDPAESTGLAHYLEHMMFKGTNKFGTKDWEAEQKALKEIENMFEEYRTITDPEERKAFYEKIDQKSNEASKLAIANEYDKMSSTLGYTGTNAYTTNDRTVYVNNIPANQIENFLDIESNRFQIIVNRLFHTELEAVYEEKNRGLDNDYRKVYEAMNKTMFTKHPYGTQSVIGTIEHLKNPSIKDINEYFYKYYVPNNMAICMSGDLNPETTIKLIDQYFGKLTKKPLAEYVPIVEPALTASKEVTVMGPDKERVMVGFRMGGSNSEDYAKAQLVDYMFDNSTAGLINLNLTQKQKVLGAGSYSNAMNDYSIHNFWGEPREGQTLEEVRNLLLGQIEILKKGEFEDWLIPAIINDFKKVKMEQMESNYSRANDMVMAFTNNMTWEEYINLIPKMEALTKEDVIKFANEKYVNNVTVYKKTGEDPNKIRVDKPKITPVDLDRTSQSDFLQRIQNRKVADVQPVFVDYDKDIAKTTMKSDVPVLYKENTENSLFTLYYLLETGTNENPKVALALDYLQYLGTESLDAESFKKELYKLGCNFGINSSEERIYVYLSGLNENMKPAMKLFEDLLANPKGDTEVLQNMISDTHKSRGDAKKEKWRILWKGLSSYAKYGPNSPHTNVLSNDELNKLQSDELINIIQSVPKMEHKILYYGPMKQDKVVATLNDLHQVPEKMMPLPTKKVFATTDMVDPNVFFTNYDMVQAEMMLMSKQDQFNKEILPEVNVFNEYFGSGMSSVLFQEIRESRGLAYSVFSRYNVAQKAEDNDYLQAYVGTQADKQEEALDALVDLLNNLPESEKNFENSKKAILGKIESSRITKTAVFFNYLSAQRKNLDYDIRKDVYARVKDMTFADLKTFHGKYVKDKKWNVAVVGDEKKMNFKALSKYGKVNKLSLDEIFGYEEYKQPVKG